MTVNRIDLLKITRPEQLFSPNLNDAKAQMKMLAQQFHPDHNKHPDANKSMAHVNALYAEAVKKINGNYWGGEGYLELKRQSGATFFNGLYWKCHSVLVHNLYVCPEDIVYVGKTDMASAMRRFKYANDKMKEEVSRLLPGASSAAQLEDNSYGYRVAKPTDLILLKDAVMSSGGTLHPRHTAWIMSRLYNLCCYLNYAKLAHLDISLETCYIQPALHSVALLGGWWYAYDFGSAIVTLPARTHTVLPWEVRRAKEASYGINQEQVKLIGRELLGDRAGVKLHAETPDAMRKWLNQPADGKPVEEYEEWFKMLEKAFGPRRFTKLDLAPANVY